jgi:hypothetical protein
LPPMHVLFYSAAPSRMLNTSAVRSSISPFQCLSSSFMIPATYPPPHMPPCPGNPRLQSSHA